MSMESDVEKYASTLKQTGKTKVDVTIGAYDNWISGLNMAMYELLVKIESDAGKSLAYKSSWMRASNSVEKMKQIYHLDKNAIDTALAYAGLLKAQDLEVSVNGKELDSAIVEIRESLKKYEIVLEKRAGELSAGAAVELRKATGKEKIINYDGKIKYFEDSILGADEMEIEELIEKKLRESERTLTSNIKY